ncbi:MAG: hypothetical protein ACXVQY_11390 [Actinomycetota bacterium]
MLQRRRAPAPRVPVPAGPHVRALGGPDAADHELLERINRDIPPSCDTVVIGSGDGIFAGVVRELRARAARRGDRARGLDLGRAVPRGARMPPDRRWDRGERVNVFRRRRRAIARLKARIAEWKIRNGRIDDMTREELDAEF